MIINTRELFKTMQLSELEQMDKELKSVIFERKINDLSGKIGLDYYIAYSNKSLLEHAQPSNDGMYWKEVGCIRCKESGMSINREKNCFMCSRCMFAGDLWRYISEEKEMNLYEAYDYLKDLLESGAIKKYGEPQDLQ